MIEKICLVLMLLLAIVAIMSISLRNAVILIAIYSLLSSYVYLLYCAPDVAIAEAVIGAAFTAIIFWVAIKRHKQIRIYYVTSQKQNNVEGGTEKRELLAKIKTFLEEKELQPAIIYAKDTLQDICGKDDFDYIVQETKESMILYGRKKDHHFEELQQKLIGGNVEIRKIEENAVICED